LSGRCPVCATLDTIGRYYTKTGPSPSPSTAALRPLWQSLRVGDRAAEPILLAELPADRVHEAQPHQGQKDLHPGALTQSGRDKSRRAVQARSAMASTAALKRTLLVARVGPNSDLPRRGSRPSGSQPFPVPQRRLADRSCRSAFRSAMTSEARRAGSRRAALKTMARWATPGEYQLSGSASEHNLNGKKKLVH
jgi:hypothetical protein